ncbi:hypothetical protein CN335_05910 [Bacillus thuringiensis]|nr:hypothetical protein BK762_24660 [Bacillus thuringiensis serovar toumanoffi]PFF42310.1 hypothetical protein CN335_05910 [Bacillus thuringiensis]PFT11110.1 hypothetical protein COK83_22660 [Bacillus thuringiensis]RFB53167.1 hypothetical protein DZB90_27495 [Bacillus thuringiensis]
MPLCLHLQNIKWLFCSIKKRASWTEMLLMYEEVLTENWNRGGAVKLVLYFNICRFFSKDEE